MSYDVYWVKNRAEKIADFEHPTQMGNVEVRKNEEGYELNLNTLIYSELLMSNARFLVTNQICRVLP